MAEAARCPKKRHKARATGQAGVRVVHAKHYYAATLSESVQVSLSAIWRKILVLYRQVRRRGGVGLCRDAFRRRTCDTYIWTKPLTLRGSSHICALIVEEIPAAHSSDSALPGCGPWIVMVLLPRVGPVTSWVERSSI